MDSLPPDFFILDDESNYGTNDINSILTQQQRSHLAKGFDWDNESGLGNNNISSQQLVSNVDHTNDKHNDLISGQPTHLLQSLPAQGHISIAESASADASRTISNAQLNLVGNDSSNNSNNNTTLVYTQINPQFVVYASPAQTATYPFQYQQSSVPFLPEVDIQAFQQEYTLRAFSKHSLLSLHAEIADILKTYDTNRITNNVNIQWIQSQVSSPTKSAVLIHYLIQEIRTKNMQQPVLYPPMQTPYFYPQPTHAPSFPQQHLGSNSYGHYQEQSASTIHTELPSTITSQPLESLQQSTQSTQPAVPSAANVHPAPTPSITSLQPPFVPSTSNNPSIELPDFVGKKKQYACSHFGCTKSFHKKSRLTRHEETHEKNRKRFFCAEKDCEKSYATKWDLVQHQREKHQIISNLYLCPFKECCEKFEVKKSWEVHIKEHKQLLNETNQTCDLSRLVFSFSGTLTKKRSEFAKMVTDHGAQVQSTVSHKVTHLVSTPVDVANNSVQVKEAKRKGIFIVSEGFVVKCVQEGKKVPEKDFLLVPHGEGADKNQQDDSSPSFKKLKVSEELSSHDVDTTLK